jgi:hypothetical protein
VTTGEGQQQAGVLAMTDEGKQRVEAGSWRRASAGGGAGDMAARTEQGGRCDPTMANLGMGGRGRREGTGSGRGGDGAGRRR